LRISVSPYSPPPLGDFHPRLRQVAQQLGVGMLQLLSVPSRCAELVLEGCHGVTGFNPDLGLPRRFSMCPPTSRLPYLCPSPSSPRLLSPERARMTVRVTRGKALAARTAAISAHKVSPSSECGHAHDGDLWHAVSSARHRLPRLLFLTTVVRALFISCQASVLR
jgi:hypothetical protein